MDASAPRSRFNDAELIEEMDSDQGETTEAISDERGLPTANPGITRRRSNDDGASFTPVYVLGEEEKQSEGNSGGNRLHPSRADEPSDDAPRPVGEAGPKSLPHRGLALVRMSSMERLAQNAPPITREREEDVPVVGRPQGFEDAEEEEQAVQDEEPARGALSKREALSVLERLTAEVHAARDDLSDLSSFFRNFLIVSARSDEPSPTEIAELYRSYCNAVFTGRQQGHQHQPTETDCTTLEHSSYHRLVHALQRASLTDWVRLVMAHANRQDRSGTIFHNSSASEWDDQKERASHLAKLIEEKIRLRKKSRREKVRVILLDGHGRILALTLAYLSERSSVDLDADIEIVVVDIDEWTDKFHRIFFPSTVICKKDTIMNPRLYKEGGVVYMNFCNLPGASDQNEELKEYLNTPCRSARILPCFRETVIKLCEYLLYEMSCLVMVSFVIDGPSLSAVKTADDNLTNLGCYKILIEHETLWKSTIVSERPASSIERRRGEGIVRCSKSGGSGPFVTASLRPRDGGPEETPDQVFIRWGIHHYHPEMRPGTIFVNRNRSWYIHTRNRKQYFVSSGPGDLSTTRKNQAQLGLSSAIAPYFTV